MLSIVSEEGQRAKQQMMPVAKYLAQLLLSFCLRHIEQKAASTPLVSPGLVVFHGCFPNKYYLFGLYCTTQYTSTSTGTVLWSANIHSGFHSSDVLKQKNKQLRLLLL